MQQFRLKVFYPKRAKSFEYQHQNHAIFHKGYCYKSSLLVLYKKYFAEMFNTA